VTGAAVRTDVNGTYAAKEEPDPLGRELSTPPDPTFASDTLNLAKFNDSLPIEYTGGPTPDFLKSQSDWARDMDLRSLRSALVNGFNATALLILQKNPNIGIRTPDGHSIYGTDALTYIKNNASDELLPFGMTLEAASDLGVNAPQKPGFSLGGPGFSDEQLGILADSFKRISKDDCTNFIKATLAKYKVGKEFNSLEKLLHKATLGRYDVDADYTDADLGVDIHSTILLRDAFVNRGASAVTVGTHAFLSDRVFERSSSIIPIQSWNRIADTPSYIVHELFHIAGIDKSIVDSQEMTDAIRSNCRLNGSERIILRH